jgi:hypothetical protein
MSESHPVTDTLPETDRISMLLADIMAVGRDEIPKVDAPLPSALPESDAIARLLGEVMPWASPSPGPEPANQAKPEELPPAAPAVIAEPVEAAPPWPAPVQDAVEVLPETNDVARLLAEIIPKAETPPLEPCDELFGPMPRDMALAATQPLPPPPNRKPAPRVEVVAALPPAEIVAEQELAPVVESAPVPAPEPPPEPVADVEPPILAEPETLPAPPVYGPLGMIPPGLPPAEYLIPLGDLSVRDFFAMVNWKNDPTAARHPIRPEMLAELQLAGEIPFYEPGPNQPDDRWSVATVLSEMNWE